MFDCHEARMTIAMSFGAVFYQQSRSTVCGHLTASWCTLCQVQQTADEEDDSRHGEHGPADRCAGVARCAGARACGCTRLHDGACSCESQRHAGAVSSQIIRCVPALTLILTVLSISMFISTKTPHYSKRGSCAAEAHLAQLAGRWAALCELLLSRRLLRPHEPEQVCHQQHAYGAVPASVSTMPC